MKTLILVLLFIAGCGNEIIQPSIQTDARRPEMESSIRNVQFHNPIVSFDIYAKNLSGSPFYAGGCVYNFEYPKLSLANPTLTNVNSRFTIGSPSQSYEGMLTESYEDGETYVAILFKSFPPSYFTGDTITRYGDWGERICTVNFTYVNHGDVEIWWVTTGKESSVNVDVHNNVTYTNYIR